MLESSKMKCSDKTMVREKLTSEKLYIRIICLTVIFLIAFIGTVALSYFFLPDGFLNSYSESRDFETSSNLLVSTLQIFLFNQMSVVAILVGSIFAKKRKEKECYLTLGYYCFLLLVLLNAVILGTGSFSSTNTASIPLMERIAGMFHFAQHAGMIEMFGLLLIACSLADKYLVMTHGKNTSTRSIKEITWKKQEILCIIIGILLMLFAAFIESRAIIAMG
ncbi:MAG: hypothetical protein HDT39_01620 [Lachnospiraceae bacterium]|nr:hypothetical protein [Lachnospiraceae bacterium]